MPAVLGFWGIVGKVFLGQYHIRLSTWAVAYEDLQAESKPFQSPWKVRSKDFNYLVQLAETIKEKQGQKLER